MDVLTVPGNLDSLDIIGKYMVETATRVGLDKKAAYTLRLAVDEIATNIALYGYERAGLAGMITIRTAITDDTLTVTLEDTAIAYDPRNTPAPDLDLPLDMRPIGGLGVFLAIEGVDEFNYERVDNRNRNIFVMKRPSRVTV